MSKVRKSGILITALLVLGTALAGCGAVTTSASGGSRNSPTNSTGNNKSNPTIKVALMPKAMGIPYFNGADQGAQQVTNQLAINLTFNGPTTASASDQVSMINSYVAEQYNVIAVSANDPTTLVPALKQAMAKGVKVVTWDSDVGDPSARNFFVNQVDVNAFGTAMVKLVADHFKGQNVDVAILSSTPTATNQNQWIAAMKQAVQTTYTNIHFVTTQYGMDQPSTALTAAESILKGYPNVKAIIAPDSVSLPSAAEAVNKLGEQGKIYVTGGSDPITMKKYMDNGTVENYVLWDVPRLGELAMYVARAAVDGKISENGTFTCPLGSFQVTNGTVLLGPPTVFDRSMTDSANY